jgi:RecA-family ATPase
MTPPRPTPLRAAAEREPPYNTDAEQALLGAIFIKNGEFRQVSRLLRAEDFGNAVHGRIFSAIGTLLERGQTADPVTLKNLFDQDEALTSMGGARYLARLAADCPLAASAVDYAALVADLARRRELINACETAIDDAHQVEPDRPAPRILDELAARVAKMQDDLSRPDPESLVSIDPATLHGLPVPQRQWLVPDWIPMARATSLYGSGGEGKTLLAQMLATACAIDDAKWLGLRVRRCNSVLQFCEDDLEEMHRRQEDINKHYGCTFADLGAMRWLPRLGEDNVLMTFDNGRAHRTPLLEQLLAIVKEHAAGLVITDTLADIFSGNESDRGQARLFAQSALGYIARETGAASLTLAHPSLTGMANGSTGSGSTGWKGTFRSQLYLEPPEPEEGEPPDADIRVLRRAKANYARRDETIEIRWKDGVFVPVNIQTGIFGSIARSTARRVFLDMIDQTTAEKRPVCSNSRAGNYAPKLFAKRPGREGFRRADFERAMEELFADGELTNASYGRPSDPRYRIARKLNGNGKDTP